MASLGIPPSLPVPACRSRSRFRFRFLTMVRLLSAAALTLASLASLASAVEYIATDGANFIVNATGKRFDIVGVTYVFKPPTPSFPVVFSFPPFGLTADRPGTNPAARPRSRPRRTR